MNGPEHYREAERLLTGAQDVLNVAPIDGLTRVECAELAQVHATLALAAATVLPLTQGEIFDDHSVDAWAQETFVPRQKQATA